MREASKTAEVLGPSERSILVGNGIDIGCGRDPITPAVRRFDLDDGDANAITNYVHEQFDFVFSSHCLEHMNDPRNALHEWWKLVKPGGHLFFAVPDEDLYEQGVFPSQFNRDHKATFTISKAQSWSPVSINVLDLACSLPNAQLVSVMLQDHGYDRRLMKHGIVVPPWWVRFLYRAYKALQYRKLVGKLPVFETLKSRYLPVDQTLGAEALAQIQCIVKRLA